MFACDDSRNAKCVKHKCMCGHHSCSDSEGVCQAEEGYVITPEPTTAEQWARDHCTDTDQGLQDRENVKCDYIKKSGVVSMTMATSTPNKCVALAAAAV